MVATPVDMKPPVGAEAGLPLTSIVDDEAKYRYAWDITENPTTNDLLLNVSPPRLNSDLGWLETSQIESVSVIGSLHSSSATSVSVSGLSLIHI